MTLAIIFESVGIGEWFVLLAVLLIVVGPKRLPATARKFGQYYSKFRRAADGFKRQLMEMDTEINTAVQKAEQEVSAATDGMVGAADGQDYGSGPEDYETDYESMGLNPPEPTEASPEPKEQSEAAGPSAEPAKPARDLSAVKITVSQAPTGEASRGH